MTSPIPTVFARFASTASSGFEQELAFSCPTSVQVTIPGNHTHRHGFVWRDCKSPYYDIEVFTTTGDGQAHRGPYSCFIDFDQDGSIGLGDLALMLSGFGLSQAPPEYDSFGFESFQVGPLGGQFGWTNDSSSGQ